MKKTILWMGLIGVLTASPAAGQGEGDLAQLYEAAKKEGKVVIYQSSERAIQEALQAAFVKRYPGIVVEVTYGRGSQNREKVKAEARAGKRIADLFDSGWGSLTELAEENLLQRFHASGMKQIYPEVTDPTGYQNRIRLNLYGITINTERVPPGQEPRGWADLTNPKWAGKIAMQDPRPGGGSGLTWLISMWKDPRLGEPYLRRMAQQKIFFDRNNGKILKDLARGEHFLMLTASNGNVFDDREKGAPLKFIIPKEGVFVIPIGMGVIVNAPHPHAAKLWIEFALSTKGQQIVADLGYTPARRDVPGKSEETNIAGVKIFPLETREDNEKRPFYVQKATEIFF